MCRKRLCVRSISPQPTAYTPPSEDSLTFDSKGLIIIIMHLVHIVDILDISIG